MTIVLPLADDQKMCAFVDRRHPAFIGHLPHWTFCESTFEGGRSWFAWNIHAYLKEGTREYADRLGRAYRFNHTKEVVSLVSKYIFKQGVIRNFDDTPKVLLDFWKHATLDGDPIDALMKQIADMSSVNGRVWVAIDSKVEGAVPISVADEKNSQQRIYAYLIKQQDVLDFARDEWGKLLWILYRVKWRDDSDPVNSSGHVRTRYMLWTREEWILLEERYKTTAGAAATPIASVVVDPINQAIYNQALVNGVASIQSQVLAREANPREIALIDRGPNQIGQVPVFPSDHVENHEHYAPPGLIDEIAYLDRAVANYLSNLDAIIQDQTFSQLAMPAQNLMPGEEAYSKMLEMGTKRIFLYDGEGGATPTYISPDAAQAGLIISTIKTIIGEIYHSVGMAGERTKQDNSMGIDNSSGVAKAYDFDRMNALLCAKSAMLQSAEERIAHFVMLWAGETDDENAGNTGTAAGDEIDNLIKYPDSYDVRGLPDEFEIAESLALLEAPPSLRRQQMDVIVEKLFPRLAIALKKQIAADMKDWPADPLETAAAMASISATAKLGAVTGSVKKPIGGPAPGATKPKTQGQNPGK